MRYFCSYRNESRSSLGWKGLQVKRLFFFLMVTTGLLLTQQAFAQLEPLPSLVSPLPVLPTQPTNNPDFVVKQLHCVDYDVGGVVVNKSKQPFYGTLYIAVKDEEGDIVGRTKVKLRVDAENGKRFSVYYINTLNCVKHKFDFKVE